jgi:uncharacterized delta-60 repeat protein
MDVVKRNKTGPKGNDMSDHNAKLSAFTRCAKAWLASLLLGATFVAPARAGPGALDPGFGAGGLVTTDFAGSLDAANAVAVQADGKIVAAGFAFTGGTNFDFALARYNPDGSPDAGFGTNGRVTTDFFGSTDVARAIALQPDGKIVVAGEAQRLDASGFDFALARYNADGSLDASFGAGGKVTTGFGSSFDNAHALALQPDGRIVVAGETIAVGTSNDFALARYNADGSLDASFGVSGKVTTDFAGRADSAAGVVLQPDGRIVVTGFASGAATGTDVALARYNGDGSLDTTFGTGGLVTTDFSGGTVPLNNDGAASVALQPDGKIVVAGFTTRELTFVDFALARYNADGSLDAGFGQGGTAVLSFLGNGDVDAASGLAIQADGKIVVGGTTATATQDFGLARYDADGRLDLTFGINGKVTTDVSGAPNSAFALALQPDGRIVLAGQVQPSDSNSDFALARYLNPPVITVAIDIKPGASPNTINLGSGGNVPVAILSSERFDAAAVDPLTVRLAGAAVALKGKGTPSAILQDVNGDGLADLVVHVDTEALQLSATDIIAVLTATTFDGRAIAGTDSVRIVP